MVAIHLDNTLMAHSFGDPRWDEIFMLDCGIKNRPYKFVMIRASAPEAPVNEENPFTKMV